MLEGKTRGDSRLANARRLREIIREVRLLGGKLV